MRLLVYQSIVHYVQMFSVWIKMSRHLKYDYAVMHEYCYIKFYLIV